MQFEWDERKAALNIAKHGVSFTLAQEVWDDPLHVLIPDQTVDGEQRWRTLGIVDGVVLLLVVHAYRARDGSECIRIISARRATKHERRSYEEDS